MSTKYYRVKKESSLWAAGAILTDQGKGQYVALEDVWDKTKDQSEYISYKIVEHPENSDWFERVYQDTLQGKLFRTKDQVLEMYNGAFKK